MTTEHHHNYFANENLSQCPIHGYIPFSSATDGEVSERDIVDREIPNHSARTLNCPPRWVE